MKKILVTGGAGYIGSHFAHHLVRSQIDPKNIIIFDNLSQGQASLVPKDVNLVVGDLRDVNSLKSVFERWHIDSVVHFAGSAYVGESMKVPLEYFQNNIYGVLNLLDCVLKHGCKKIVFSSSCAVYGAQIGGSIDESHPLNPISPYGESKKIVEQMLTWVSEIHKVKVISLRYFNVAGVAYELKEMHDPETHIIPILLRDAIDGKVIKIFGGDYDTADGTCVRDFIHIIDLVEAHLCALKYFDSMKASYEVFNLGSNNSISMLDLIKRVEKILPIKVLYEFVERREGDPPFLQANSDKAREILSWQPYNGIDQILESAFSSIKVSK